MGPAGTEDILLSGAQFSKMLQLCSGDLHTWKKLNSNSNSNVHQGRPDHLNTFLSAENTGNETSIQNV